MKVYKVVQIEYDGTKTELETCSRKEVAVRVKKELLQKKKLYSWEKIVIEEVRS